MFRAELVALVVGLLLLAWLLWRRSWGEAAWVAATVGAFCTSFWIYSLTRATLLWWPLWIGLAVLAQRKPWLGRLYLALAIPLAAIWAAGLLHRPLVRLIQVRRPAARGHARHCWR